MSLMSGCCRFVFACLTVGVTVLAEADDVSKTSTVSGKVSLPDGQPASGADVHLLRSTGGSYSLPVKTRKVTSADDGKYVFEGVKPGRYKIWAETPQLTSLKKKLGGKAVAINDSGKPVVVPLPLHEGCNYRVKVISAATGEPLPSATVSFGWTDLPRQYKANAEGIVEIGGLGVDDWYFIVAADGHGIQFKKTPEQELGSTTELEFKLGPGGDLLGLVRTEEGTPVAGAVVYASARQGGMQPNYGREVSDQNGEFVFKNLPAGVALRVSANKKDHTRKSVDVVIAAGESETFAEVICNPRPYGGDVIVTVVDEAGQPIAGASLTNPGNSSANNRTAESGADGSARLANMYATYAGHRVFVRAPGFIAQQINVEPGTIENPGTAKVEMVRGKRLRGKLVDPDGKPAPRIRIYYNEGEHPWTLGGRVMTDENGEFEIDGLPEASTLTVYTPREFAPIRDMKVTAGQDEPITITMSLAAVVRVRAMDAKTGKPIPEFNVKVRNSPDRERDEPWGSFSTAYSEQGTNILGDQKVFTMPALVEGTPLEVTVSAKGYLSKRIKRILAVRNDRAKVTDVALEMDSPDNYESIAGTLVDNDGNPVIGASVRLIVGKIAPFSEAAQAAGARPDAWRFYHWDLVKRGDIKRAEQCLQFLESGTDANGRFVFDKVRRDGAWLELFHTGGNVAPARFPDLRKSHDGLLGNLALTAKLPASVTLFVNREKWPGAHSVRLQAPDWIRYPDCIHHPFSYQSVVIEGDSVTFENLPAGEYQVMVQAKPTPVGNNGFRTNSLGSRAITVPEGEALEGEL